MKNIEHLMEGAIEFLGVFIFFIGQLLFIVTLPIWILPYLLYKKLKWRL